MKNINAEKWLIIAHCFNMDGRAASQTITDKIPFLMKKGIEPVVISAPTGTKDKNFIHSQIISPAPSGLIFEMRKILEKHFQKGILLQFLKALVSIFLFPFLIFEKIFINLDSHWSWFITASIRGVFIIKKHRPKLIYSSAGPSSSHLTGLILNKLFKLPWIAEIHDPLISESKIVKKRYQRYIFHRWLEKIILKNACAIIYFTIKACENAKKRIGNPNNVHLLRPGANPPETSSISYHKREKIHFGHFGSLSSDRNLYNFMEALSYVFKKEPYLKNKVVLDIYGTKLDPVSRKAVRKFSLDDVVCEHGRLEFDFLTGKSGRQQVFEKMYITDVLVLIHGRSNISYEYIPSKFYEYQLTTRPIIGLTSQNSELASILNSFGYTVVHPADKKKIETILKGLISEWENDQLPEYNQVSFFSVENTVDKIMELSELNNSNQIHTQLRETQIIKKIPGTIPIPHKKIEVDCCVIHVKKGYEDRADSIVKQFSRIDLPFEWILDHDKDEITPQLLKKYKYSGNLKKEEISCSLKHICAWERIARGNSNGAFVFEDDVFIDKNKFNAVTQEAIAEFYEKWQGYGYISLGCGCALYVPWTKKRKNTKLYLAEQVRAADSYWINRETARMKIQWIRENGFSLPADHLINKIAFELEIPILWLDPAIVAQGSHTGLFASSIQDLKRGKFTDQIGWKMKIIRRKYLYPLVGIDLRKNDQVY